MEKKTMDSLVQRWTDDAEFREAFRSDPEAALARAGVEPTAEERAALGELRGLDDAALEARISKIGFC